MLVRFRSLAVVGTVALGAACGGTSSSANPEPGEAVDQAATQVAAGSSLTGEQVVEYICSQCHSMDPPALTAPPLTHVARHLRSSFASVDEAVAHVIAYAPSPDAERSIMPEMARERFGLMPPQPLPEPMLEAAARYIWTLSDGTETVVEPGEMGGPGMGRGMGNGRAGGGGMN